MNNPHCELPDHSVPTEHFSPRGDSSQTHAGGSPTAEELTSCLFFSPDDGRIWLNDQRMLLLHTSSFGTLRREIIERLGQEQARGMFTRAGYLSGARDARLIRERWPQADASSAFRAGTHLHTLEGMTKVEPLHFKFDAESGFYEGSFSGITRAKPTSMSQPMVSARIRCAGPKSATPPGLSAACSGRWWFSAKSNAGAWGMQAAVWLAKPRNNGAMSNAT